MRAPWPFALGIGAVVAVLVLLWPAGGSPAAAGPPLPWVPLLWRRCGGTWRQPDLTSPD